MNVIKTNHMSRGKKTWKTKGTTIEQSKIRASVATTNHMSLCKKTWDSKGITAELSRIIQVKGTKISPQS